jgi:hypothetical protein
MNGARDMTMSILYERAAIVESQLAAQRLL